MEKFSELFTLRPSDLITILTSYGLLLSLFLCDISSKDFVIKLSLFNLVHIV